MTLSKNQQVMMGHTTAQDQKIPVALRDWNAMKLACWRSKTAFEIIAHAVDQLLPTCLHANGCGGVVSDNEPCIKDRYETHMNEDGTSRGELVSKGCPDRELRMSLLVMLNAAKMFAPINGTRPVGEPYMAPSREYYSELVAELGAAQVEVERLRTMLRDHGVEPSPAAQVAPQLEGQQQ